MSKNNQLSPVDILAMKNFNKARNFMDASLGEEVGIKFKQAFQGIHVGNI